MKIVALVSSPRKHSNSKLLAEAVLSGAKENGAETELITIIDKNINPCHADGSCKAPGSKGCGVKDDMQAVYQSIAEADAVVLAAPIYFGRLNAPMSSTGFTASSARKEAVFRQARRRFLLSPAAEGRLRLWMRRTSSLWQASDSSGLLMRALSARTV
ncbi:MAG: flavodoxin family protein [Methanocorpusculum sp.]|nr:flavodoxin family protein [Methanocorpusculum sp.]